MANTAPGVNINVTASASNNNVSVATGNWFVLGSANGPSNVAVPITSTADFVKYFGFIPNSGGSDTVNNVVGRYVANSYVDSTVLFDSLDVFFREGGINAYVSTVLSASDGSQASTDPSGAYAGAGFTLTANGYGSWANSNNNSPIAGLIVYYTCTGTSIYSATITRNGFTLANVSGLTGVNDLINWINSLPPYISMCTAAATSASGTLPTLGNTVTLYFAGGADSSTNNTDFTRALSAFNALYGPGQVSYPGNDSSYVWTALTNHAQQYNRVAVLDPTYTTNPYPIADFANYVANNFDTQPTDSSYASAFYPWLIVPGYATTTSSNVGYGLTRLVPPSALAAAKMAANDSKNDCNVPAAGIKQGAASYVTGLSTYFSDDDRAALNQNGVNAIRLVPGIGTICIYGFRSLATNPNWNFLNNVRFRMQVIRDFDVISEPFVFQEIDSKGQIFSTLAGALSGQCSAYWTRQSIYGSTAQDAYTVNAGTQINTPATIAAGQLNAEVNLRMSPFGEQVTVNVNKYLVSASLPNYTA